MKPKKVLLLFIILVILLEIMFITSIFKIKIDLSELLSPDFIIFLVNNPILIFVIVIIVITMFILYLAIKVD
jgi:hypothetical protein